MLASLKKIIPLKYKTYTKQYLQYLYLLAFWKKEADVKFVIFCQGRSGSTVLTDLLNNSNEVFVDNELFNINIHGLALSPLLFIKSRVKRYSNQHKGYGFKLKVYDMTREQKEKFPNPKAFLESLQEEGYKFIFLHRENVLSQSLSNFRGDEYNLYHQKKDDNNKSKTYRLNVNLDKLMQYMEGHERFHEDEIHFLENIDYHKITYENDLLDSSKHLETANNIFKYLGLNQLDKVNTNLMRTSKPIKEMVENYQEVDEYLKGTKYHSMLN